MRGRRKKQGWAEEVKQQAQQSLGQPDEKFWNECGLPGLTCIRLKWPGLYNPALLHHQTQAAPGGARPRVMSAAVETLQEEVVCSLHSL